ncbi:MAG TPA: hypothetical protein VF173_03910 [Thermoanaerobaculia bacterium]|nr:hypothetical protein [Thermoanaerobaculia bacterium]
MKRKLVVNRETLRNLNTANLKNTDLVNVAGGRFVTNHPTICDCNESISCYTCAC